MVGVVIRVIVRPRPARHRVHPLEVADPGLVDGARGVGGEEVDRVLLVDQRVPVGALLRLDLARVGPVVEVPVALARLEAQDLGGELLLDAAEAKKMPKACDASSDARASPVPAELEVRLSLTLTSSR